MAQPVGLYYLRARYYDPSVGRFTSEDTYRGDATDPASLNLYTYCGNDPVNYTDPTGHWAYPTGALKKAADSLRKKAAGGGSASSSSQSSASSGSKESDLDDLIGKFKAFVGDGSSSSGSSRSGGADSSISGLLPGYDIDPGFSIKAPFDSSYDPGFSMWDTDEIMEAIKQAGESLKDLKPKADGALTPLSGSGGGSSGGGAGATVNGRKIGNVTVEDAGYFGNLRDIANASGATYNWDSKNLTVTMTFWKDGLQYVLTVTFNQFRDGEYCNSMQIRKLVGGAQIELDPYDSVEGDMLKWMGNGTNFFLQRDSDGLLKTKGKISNMAYMMGVSDVRIYNTPAPKPAPSKPDYSIYGITDNMRRLTQLATQYKQSSGTAVSVNELVLQYIRRGGKYTGGRWPTVTGQIDWGFVAYVGDNTSDLAGYFHDNVVMEDPLTLNDIDFVHWAATMNGLIYDTGWSDVGYKSLIGEHHIDNLCGWAGDLQTLLTEVIDKTDNSSDYNTLYDKASKLMGNASSKFSMADLLADADAANIYNMIGGKSLVDAFSEYYNGANEKRFRSFTSQYNNFNELGLDAMVYTQKYYGVKQWPLLEGIEVSENQAGAVAEAYSKFIWNQVQAEGALYH